MNALNLTHPTWCNIIGFDKKSTKERENLHHKVEKYLCKKYNYNQSKQSIIQI